jgi:hypothetical protein
MNEWGTCVMMHDGWHNNYTEHKWNSHLQTCKWGGFVILWHKCCTKNKVPCKWWIWGLASSIEICYILYIVLRTESQNIWYVWVGKQEYVDEPSIILYTWSYLLWGRLGAWLVYHQCHFVSTFFLCGKILSAVISACHKSLSNSGGSVVTFFPPSWAARTVLGELTNYEASRLQTRPTHNVAHATNAMCNGLFSGISIKSSLSDTEVFFRK